MKNLIIAIVAIFTLVSPALANEKMNSTYNMSRAKEALAASNTSEANEYLLKEIGENPKNGYAHLYLAGIKLYDEALGDAWNHINLAIKNIPKKDKESYSTAWFISSKIHYAIGDTVTAFDNLAKAIAITPDETDLYELRGDWYYYQGQYEQSNKDYKKLMELDPSSVMGYMGMGRNAIALGDYETAQTLFSKVQKIYPDYSSAYSFRAETYLYQEKYVNAIDDICRALEIDGDKKAINQLFKFPKDKINLVVAKLKSYCTKHPLEPDYWYYIGQVYANIEKYIESNDAYNKFLGIDHNDQIVSFISNNYVLLGDYDNALAYINQAIQLDPENENYLVDKADILTKMGVYEQAISIWASLVEAPPDYSSCYTSRAQIYNLLDNYDAAIADYEMAITLNPDYAYTYTTIGDLYRIKGNTNKATKAYEQAIALDSPTYDSPRAMFAYLALGRNDEAIDFMNKVLEADTTLNLNNILAARFYSRMGNTETASQYLEKYLEKGATDFLTIRTLRDLENLRATPKFESLMQKYEPQQPDFDDIKTIDELQTVDPSEIHIATDTVTIPFTPYSGCAKVDCAINGLPLSFVFDTGASLVSLSMTEANFMFKNGYLTSKDVIGNEWFYDANGDVNEGTIINIREVNFGGLTLNNVKATVVRNQKAPLLLGQSVLRRLGKIEIDNQNQKLIITTY